MNYTNLTDHDWWQLCRQDDTQAYNDLFDRCYTKPFSLSTRFIKGCITTEELFVKNDSPVNHIHLFSIPLSFP